MTLHLAVGCRTFQEINVESLTLQFRAVAEKTAKNLRGLLYFAAPGRDANVHVTAAAAAAAVVASWVC